VTPAGLGAVEGGMIVALKLLNVDAATAGAIALADRGIAYWSVIVIGGVAWLAQQRRGRRTGRLTSRPATVALASAPPD
jgi:uncharacterized protein (TIRG00374 family)